MKTRCLLATLTLTVLCPPIVFAQTPAGATGKCKDGTFTKAARKAGACSSHNGIDTWFGTPAAAPGGGPGLVWVNTKENVYHCYGAAYYGTTKGGKYMSETDAKAAGAHADHNRSCSR